MSAFVTLRPSEVWPRRTPQGVGAGARRTVPVLGRLVALLFGAALLLWAPASRAAQDDPRLADLFKRLQTTTSDEEAQATEQEIWRIWAENKNPEIERLMREGMADFATDDAESALEAFNQVVEYDKDFAEGWNKRATVEFALGRYDASVADIEHTLALEPRHFGALAGLGEIYLRLDRKAPALKAFRAALAIDPHLATVREEVKALEKELGGSPI